LLTVTTNGYGKRTNIGEYPSQARGGLGIKNILLGNNFVCGVMTVTDTDEILVSTKNGTVIRMPATQIREQGRSTRGLCIMDVAKGDEISAITKISS
ncbi:MAG: DNA gyrase C-terminal beta-propeller domain-containing protein, partial [Candidatus Gracilibacteria bacterium]|nr:DNA gyrase C-terminal beta-propeller domain-containing protein [Candidatus Gracilibacteria bacterium]